MVHIGNDWDEILKGEFDKEYYRRLRRVLVNEYRTQTVFPPPECIFNALKLTPYSEVKVVILGQIRTMSRTRRTDLRFPFCRALKFRRRF